MRNLFKHLLSRPKLEDRPVPEEDPIVHSSLSWAIAISSLLLVLSLFWALYDEQWGLRPWVDYQGRFIELYTKHLESLKLKRAEAEKEVYASQAYEKLESQTKEAQAEIKAEMARMDGEEKILKLQLAAITKPFTTRRSEVQAKIYEFETAGEEDKKDLEEELKELRKGPYDVAMPVPGNGSHNGSHDVDVQEKSYTYGEMEQEFERLKREQGELQTRRVGLLSRPTTLRRELDDYVKLHLTGLTVQQVEGLLSKMDDLTLEFLGFPLHYHSSIKQIHNAEMELVDRCESCHVGTREPVVLTKADMNGEGVFTSHPSRLLLQIHDPEVFGCSPCHNGNGTGTVSIAKAHGNYKHWLWPLYSPENFEAGCLQCHEADRRLEMAPVLNGGKQLFYEKGCWGCHPREGFAQEAGELRDTRKVVDGLQDLREQTQIDITRTKKQADDDEISNEEFKRLDAEVERLTLSLAHIDTQEHRLNNRLGELMMEVKTGAPNLKEARTKLRREWIPVWIQNPHAFRPTTKMPRFQLGEDEVEAIAAFIWQSGIQAELPRRSRGDSVSGKTLFETRGCMACHSLGEGDGAVGGTFAANLSRVGEKVQYDYLVRWIHNPRERTLPYCPVHRRDITPEDYARQGLPFEFSLEKDQCPLGDHLLQVQQTTVMPSLRLTWKEARDIATYLMSLQHEAERYPGVAYLDNEELAGKGRFLVRHYGCAGCHEIATLEEEGKVGTDLTLEGSKPIERLDFALLTHEAKQEGWYNHKGFFEHKLADPDVFDQDKIKKPLERLRMPDFSLSSQQIDQLTTFLLGSVYSVIPEKFFYHPADRRQDIQDGWWVAMKYNCVGCHRFAPGQRPVLEDLPLYQDPDWREQLPPSLIGEGARVDPNWLAGFLKNPALSERQLNRNGARPYLQARMPTFNLSDGEVQKLVRFFGALSNQPLPYMPEPIEPLSDQELVMARQLFTDPAAPCLKCHATGNPVTDRTATAPNFLLVPERLQPAWTKRWIVHPEIIRPGTAMPSGLFRRDGDRWVFALAELPSFKNYAQDHADLVVRYMFQFTQQEQRRLRALAATGMGQ